MSITAHRPTPRWTTLRPHEKQQEYYRSTARVNVVPAGRRCLVAGTLVATPTGPVPIERLRVGDEVIGFENNSLAITTVAAVYDNGWQMVLPLENEGSVYVCGTGQHKLWAVCAEEEEFRRCSMFDFGVPHAVRREYADSLIRGGTISFPLAYGIHVHNVKWSVIDTWSRESCLLYLAGVLDSCLRSYNICDDNKHVEITLCLFDDGVFECCTNIIFKYFQEHVTVISKCAEPNTRCSRYLFSMKMKNYLIVRVLSTLRGLMTTRVNIPGINKTRSQNDRITLSINENPYSAHTYDITVSNSTNLYMLHNGGIITSNSGKCVARGTLVSMADNTFKPVEQVKRGDYVWSMEQYGTFIPQKVTEAQLDSIRPCLRFRTWAGTVDVSANHPFLVMDGSWRERRERWYAKLYNKPVPRSARWKDADQLKVGDMVGIAGTCSTYAIELEQFEDREIDMTLMWQVAHNLHIDVLEPLQGNLLKAFFVTYNRMYAYKHGEILKEPIIKAIGEKVTKYPMRMLFERMRVFKHNFPIVKDTKTFGEEVGGSVIWLPILSISDTAQQEVYDLTINETHNFVANGYVTHNTEIAKRRVVRRALARVIQGNGKYHNGRFFTAAPTRDQAKRIYWNDLKALIPAKYFDGRPKETELMIPLKNNVQIHVIGMDKPERFEGTPWDGGILDEYGNMKESAWMENVFPALADRQGWVDLIGVPEGRNHYYDRWLEAVSCTDGSIRGHHWTSAEILPPEEIAMAKRMLDELSYKQEMEAEFVNFAGQCYYQFNVADHCHTLSYDKRAPLIFCFDFNVSPGVAAVIQEQVIPGSFELVQKPQYGAGVDGFARALKVGPEAMVKVPVVGTGVIGEVHIRNNSNTPAVCNKLIQDWGDHEGSILLYGDATGGSRGTAKVSGSDWDLIWSIMCNHYGESRVFMEVPQTNPSERNRINAVNTRLKSLDGTVRMAVDPDYCENIIRDFEGVRVLEGGAGEIDKKHDRMLSHLCFSGDTLVQTEKGIQKISEISKNGSIMGWNNTFHPYNDASLTIHNTNVVEVETTIVKTVCTPEHLYLTTKGWVCAQHLKNHTLITSRALLYAVKQNKFFKEYLTTERKDQHGISEILISLVSSISTELYGCFIKETYQKGFTYITSMGIDQIIKSAILKCCQGTITSHDIVKTLLRKSASVVLSVLEMGQPKQQNGTEVLKEGSGTQKMPKAQSWRSIDALANTAERNFSPSTETPSFAEKIVRQSIDITPELMTRCVLACVVDLLFSQTSTHPHDIVPGNVLQTVTNVTEIDDLIDVYCLSVPNQGCFSLLGGEIVSNSDSIGYYIAREFPVLEESVGSFRVGGRF